MKRYARHILEVREENHEENTFRWLAVSKKYISVKSAFMNPAFFSFVIAMPLYITGAMSKLPTLVTDAISLLGRMTTPVCMLILGIRLATMDFKKLFTNIKRFKTFSR